MALTRRKFLVLSGVAAAAGWAANNYPLSHFRARPPAADGSRRAKKLNTWEDLYRERWEWDSVAKGSHGWLNCRSACAFNLYVKNGVVIREEQVAEYKASEPGVPDFNPRGCNKGACYTEVMYGPSRLTVPLKRVGPRGSGQWERVSWEQALDDIATKLVDVAEKHGPEYVYHDLGPHFDNGATTAARIRFFTQFGGVMADDWGEIGDLNLGNMLTFGFPHMGGTSDEWFLSDFIVPWMMNPAVTQIPDAHFLNEARYNGATVTVVDPIYSATAIHADRWLPLKPGTDAALALCVARHIWDSGRIDLDYVREQTDLPFLVRLDTGRFLRESDLKPGGHERALLWWNETKGAPEVAPGTEGSDSPRLYLNGRTPPIEGRYEVRLQDGNRVGVAPVGTLLREQLELWTFARAAAVTGLHPELITRFADDFSKAERPLILSSWGSNRYLHSDLMNRAKILCLSLKGAIGKRGAGLNSTGWFGIDGFDFFAEKKYSGLLGSLDLIARGLGPQEAYETAMALATRKKTMMETMYGLARKAGDEMCITNSASFNLRHQGIADVLDEESLAAGYPRKLSEYDAEAREKNWMPVYPEKEAPKVWFTGGNNVLRRTNLPQRMLEHLWPQMDLIIDMNPKLTFTGMHADYLLPAAGYYEKPGIKYPVAYVPYLHYCSEAIKPIGEAKNEWEIYALLAERIEKFAKERNLPPVSACGKRDVDLKTLNVRFTMDGKFGPATAEAVNQEIFDNSASTKGFTVAELKVAGIKKYTATGSVLFQTQLYNEDWKGEGVLTVSQHQTKHKWHWPTLTGRQQFYIDHPWFLEAGESLPTHKESPRAGGDYPFQMISCHARWSVHSVWRDTPMMLRLQRGEPVVYLNAAEAEKMGLADHDWAEIYNRLGTIRMRVKHSTMVRPGVAYYFHAWEPFQFPDHKSYKWISPGPMNPLHFAGGEGQTGWTFAMFQPSTHVQDTRVGIRRAKEAS
jgi:DMSO reductase family type II enzyme molybdopterin subunit